MMHTAWWRMARRMVACCSLLLLGNCSLALNWDQNQLQCGASSDPNYNFACLENYTCDPPFCVANGSRSVGDSCSDVRQCQSTELCPLSKIANACDPTVDFSCEFCVKSCTLSDGYSDSACNPGEFCEPSCKVPPTMDASGLYVACNPNSWEAGCAKTSTCAVDTTCIVPGTSSQAGVCTQIRADKTSFACLPTCSVTVNATGFVGDTCGGTAQNPLSCVPVGSFYQQQFACMPQGAAPQHSVGQSCSITSPCVTGYACIIAQQGTVGTCYQLCMKGASSCTAFSQNTSPSCITIPGIDPDITNGADGTTNASNSDVGYCN